MHPAAKTEASSFGRGGSEGSYGQHGLGFGPCTGVVSRSPHLSIQIPHRPSWRRALPSVPTTPTLKPGETKPLEVRRQRKSTRGEKDIFGTAFIPSRPKLRARRKSLRAVYEIVCSNTSCNTSCFMIIRSSRCSLSSGCRGRGGVGLTEGLHVLPTRLLISTYSHVVQHFHVIPS